MQTLKAAIAKARRGGMPAGINALEGKPAGGWPETEQAKNELLEALPILSERGYTWDQFVNRYYRIDAAGRFRVRD